jgi:hypothetical protein
LPLASNLTINPISRGLGSIYRKETFKYARELAHRNPKSRWVVYDDLHAAGLFRAAGAPLLNGIKYAPDFDIWRLLDEEGDDVEVYNRYAHIQFERSNSINAIFGIVAPDLIRVNINPCSPALEKAHVDYFAFVDRISSTEAPCLSLLTVKPLDGRIWIYERMKDAPEASP